MANRIDPYRYPPASRRSRARRRRRRAFLRPSRLVVGLLIGLAVAAAAIGLFDGPADSVSGPVLGRPVALGVSLAGPPAPALKRFDKLVGKVPKIVMWFQTWQEPLLYTADVEAAGSIGATPMITWDPRLGARGIPLARIAAGAYDSYIRASAQMAKAYGRRLYIRFAHEMNLSSSPFGPRVNGNTPAKYVAAWRHVVRIFRQVGADKAEFVWSPNVYCNRRCPFTPFYPGDRWVNWVALDGYNYSSVDNVPWMSFKQLFGGSYAVMSRLSDRPLMIGETGCASVGGDKAQWIIGMGRALATQFRRVRALIWFQRVKETDWRVNSSPESLAAFRRVVSSFPFSS